MKLFQPITVDMHNIYPLPKMSAQQHNVGRGALITFTANGTVIVPENETIRIFAKRPDGNVSYLDCVIMDDGNVQADFTDQMLAAEGNVEVELEFTTAETNITTPIFIVEVNKSNVKDGVESSNEYKALEKYTEEAKEAAEQAQQVYDSIPTYENKLAELEQYKANAIIQTLSGTTIQTSDSAPVPPIELDIYGGSKQRTTEGHQLFDGSALTLGTNDSIDVFADGYIIIGKGGTAHGYTYSYYDVNIESILGKTVYIMADSIEQEKESTSVVQIIITLNDDSVSFYSLYPNMLTNSFVVPENAARFSVGIYSNNTDTALESVNTVIVKGLRVSLKECEWEPYTNGVSSPSMEYNQPIVSTGQRLLSGSQLLPYPYYESTTTKGGLEFIDNGDGSISIKGTTSETVWYNFAYNTNKIPLHAGTYFYSVEGIVDGVQFASYNTENDMYAYGDHVIILSETTDYEFFIQIDGGKTIDTTIYPMLNHGTEKKPYEPYTGGVEKVVDVGIDVKVLSGNLFKMETLTPENQGMYYTIDTNITKPITILSKINNATFNDYPWIVRCDYADGTANHCGFSGYMYSIPMTFNASTENPIVNITYRSYGITSGSVDLLIGYEGITEYEPYTEQTLTFPYVLRGIQINKNGHTSPFAKPNYIDKDGQEYIGDYVDFERKKLIKQIGVLNNPTFKLWTGYTLEDSELFGCEAINSINDFDIFGYGSSLCNKMQLNHVGSLYVNGFYQAYAHIFARIKGVSDETEFNNLMKDSVFHYILVDPIEIDLTESEIEAYKAITMNYPTTNIMGVGHKVVKYVCDTEKHIEQNYAPKSVTQDILARLSALEQNAVNS